VTREGTELDSRAGEHQERPQDPRNRPPCPAAVARAMGQEPASRVAKTREALASRPYMHPHPGRSCPQLFAGVGDVAQSREFSAGLRERVVGPLAAAAQQRERVGVVRAHALSESQPALQAISVRPAFGRGSRSWAGLDGQTNVRPRCALDSQGDPERLRSYAASIGALRSRPLSSFLHPGCGCPATDEPQACRRVRRVIDAVGS